MENRINKKFPLQNKNLDSDASGSNNKLTIVALGASAGGLEALSQFFENVPPDSGLAFVAVTHQAPDHISLLPELVAAHTQLEVAEAEDGDKLLPNHLYIAPARQNLSISNATLCFADSPQEKPFLPIDSFFRSLAEDQGEWAIGVILSGSGTDGTLGMKAIKGAHGMALAQSPESAKFAGMPQSAIDTGLIDFVLPAAELPTQILTYVLGRKPTSSEARGDLLDQTIPKILRQIRSRTGHDFSAYKSSTIRRRVERRMIVHQIDSPEVYSGFLSENPQEIDHLFQKLLITVTNFFRDPESYDALRIQLEELIRGKPEDGTLRVWVAGCATGEEAYSIAILIRECLTKFARNLSVQIFATDLDENAIEVARTGIYPPGIADDIESTRLQRFFVKEESGYRIKKEIREMVVFATQSMIKDPPFTKMDLLSCRNVMIYVNSDLQKRLFPIFHYALNSGGLLFLGPSESIGDLQHLFKSLDNKWKIYRRTETAITRHPEFPLSIIDHEAKNKAPLTLETPSTLRSTSELLREYLVSAFVPPTVIVDRHGDIVHVQGRTGLYLELPSGQASTNLVAMARHGLQLDLSTAIRLAQKNDEPVIHQNVVLKTDGNKTAVDISVERISAPEQIRGLLAVTFHPIKTAASHASPDSQHRPAEIRFDRLENELKYLKETLQSTSEEFETTNEELKSTNEELQSTNEELQSANEELETSREEMQSLNEELQTVNAELSSKLDELTHTHDDLQNLLNSTEIATLFLDTHLQIKRFSKSASRVFKIRPVDIGRHLSEIVKDIDYQDLVEDAKRVLDSLVPFEKEVLANDKVGCFRVRLLPYRTTDNVIAGVVITLVDIREIYDSRNIAESIIATISDPYLIVDEQMRVVSTNDAFSQLFRSKAGSTVGNLVHDIDLGVSNAPELRQLIETVMATNTGFEDFEFEIEIPEVGKRKMFLAGVRLKQQPERSGRVMIVFRSDPTASKLVLQPENDYF